MTIAPRSPFKKVCKERSVLRANIEFLLYDWLQVERLCAYPRFAAHSRDTFTPVLELCETLASDVFAPANRTADAEEPRFDGERVHLPAATHAAVKAYAGSGMLAASQDTAWGGLQLPYVVETAGNAFFAKASIALAAYSLLTVGNANLLLAHGSERQREVFARPQLEGRWFGTMCLSEPQAGSSLGDIRTRAVADPQGGDDPLGPRYRLRGNKMWISAGEHELGDNIVHLVLAKIPDEQGRLPAGTKGISLFIVPRHLTDAHGALSGERNDLSLAGLNHKLGYRGTSNCLLNFGEKEGAIGYRVGDPGEGLACMFHMMNEARIGVGLGAVMLGQAGFEASLAYARQRPQGRPLQSRDPASAPCPIIEHADVRRMLLAQKSYAEGGLALGLFCASLVDERHGGDAQMSREARVLLDLLTPIVKSWPSEWCLEANSLAIQVLGGYGYTRDFPVEQYWRDNRLNMIHEGTHGIQAQDLLGRRLRAEQGAGLHALASRIQRTLNRSRHGQACEDADLPGHAAALEGTLAAVTRAAQAAWAPPATPAQALANATPYLQAFGHMVLAWIWLELRLAVSGRADDFAQGKRAAQSYFYAFELPKVAAWLSPVLAGERVCAETQADWL
jgi:butyryl-CoA dehydrogenase